MQININKITTWLKAAGCSLLLVATMAACKKDPAQDPAQAVDGSTIKFVLNDNFTFGIVYGALTHTNLLDSLAMPGPYTFIAPDNNAYLPLGLYYPVASYTFDVYVPSRMRNELQYFILDGITSFRSMPLGEHQPYKTHTGGNIYVSKYLDGSDTVIMINGAKVISTDAAASNGLIQVSSQVLNPEMYADALSYLHSDTTLTLFSAALQRSGLDQSLLKGKAVYTLLAPSNTAFQQAASLGAGLNIGTLEGILAADPAKLAAFLQYHIIKGRYFDGDLFRYAQADPGGIATLRGDKVAIGGDPNGFNTITFLGNGNNGVPSTIANDPLGNRTIHNADIPCGNAVVHIINQVLIP